MRLQPEIVEFEAPSFLSPELIINAAGYGYREILANAIEAFVFEDENGVVTMMNIENLIACAVRAEPLVAFISLAEPCPNGPCDDCDDLGYLPLDNEM